jgi:AraC-like DNA-binding protein
LVYFWIHAAKLGLFVLKSINGILKKPAAHKNIGCRNTFESAMQTKVLQPNSLLKSSVSHILVLDKQVESDIITPLPFYADGLPGIIFHQSEGGMYMNNSNRKLSQLFLYGQTIKPITLLPVGSFRIIVVFLYPFGISALFGIRPGEITDDCVDLRLLPNVDLQLSINQLLESTDMQEQVELVSRYLLVQMNSGFRNPDNVIHYALEHIIQTSGQGSLQELRKQLNITERTFERKFEQHIGVSPKLFSRIRQFRSSMEQLQKNNFSKLSDIAYTNGYADQSHFIRSFREFTGLSPLDYIRQTRKRQTEHSDS